jgi:hypothetical protein
LAAGLDGTLEAALAADLGPFAGFLAAPFLDAPFFLATWSAPETTVYG